MLNYECSQVVQAQPVVERPYTMKGDRGDTISGVSIYSDVTVISTNGSVAVIRMKGKSKDEVIEKVAKLTPGKPAKIAIKGMEDTARGVMILNA